MKNMFLKWNEMGLQPMTFEEFKAQARAGMYAGGQSTPSDYTMEDALMTTTQDKLGGITDVMKQADLYRQGECRSILCSGWRKNWVCRRRCR